MHRTAGGRQLECGLYVAVEVIVLITYNLVVHRGRKHRVARLGGHGKTGLQGSVVKNDNFVGALVQIVAEGVADAHARVGVSGVAQHHAGVHRAHRIAIPVLEDGGGQSDGGLAKAHIGAEGENHLQHMLGPHFSGRHHRHGGALDHRIAAPHPDDLVPVGHRLRSQRRVCKKQHPHQCSNDPS